jgi:magnesium transporter
MSRKSRRRGRNTEVRRRTPPGSAPGTLVADPSAPKPVIRVMAYGPAGMVEKTIPDVSALPDFLARWPVTWINVDGLGDTSVIGKLGEIFDIHRLAQEDIINVHQRAKAEIYRKHYFIVARMTEVATPLSFDQLSLFLGPNYILTFQETPGDCFDPVRERIRKAGGRIRNAGPDYLAYALLDATIDNYFPALEHYGEVLETLEDEVVLRPEREIVGKIHEVKRDLLTLRRAVWPLREAINSLVREESPFISPETRIYLRDCYDHIIQIIDLLENYRDIASSLMEVYLSSLNNRMNEIMKVLTIFTALFIPMNLIAGIYGMNFNTEKSPFNMPELNWFLGYPFALTMMVSIAVGMYFFFRRIGWLGPTSKSRQ